MSKKRIIFCTIFVIVGAFMFYRPHKPKLVSNITIVDSAYLTILVDKWETNNIKKLEEKLLQMCRDDSFENMKLYTQDRILPENLHFFVYTSRRNLHNGTVAYAFTYEEGD